jgi:hypothetical protein
VSEFGGIGLSDAPGDLGLTRWRANAEDLVARYAAQCAALHASEALSRLLLHAAPQDAYQEVNGLLRMDRTPKAPPEALVRATTGVYRPARSASD